MPMTADIIETDAAAFANVKERYLRGVPDQRHMMPNEVLAVIRHAMRLEHGFNVLVQERRDLQLDAMSVGKPD